MYWITLFSVRNYMYSQFDFFLPSKCFCLSLCGPLGAPPCLGTWRRQRDAVWHQRVEGDPELPTPLWRVSHGPIFNERFLSADWLIWQEDHYDRHAWYVHVYKKKNPCYLYGTEKNWDTLLKGLEINYNLKINDWDFQITLWFTCF